MKNFQHHNHALESMYCPEGSIDPKGVGKCPKGFIVPLVLKLGVQLVHTATELGNGIQFHVSQENIMVWWAKNYAKNVQRAFICPGFGRVDPAICPPGYVCSQSGLDAPNARCPAGFFCPNGTLTTDPFVMIPHYAHIHVNLERIAWVVSVGDTISQGDFICPSVY